MKHWRLNIRRGIWLTFLILVFSGMGSPFLYAQTQPVDSLLRLARNMAQRGAFDSCLAISREGYGRALSLQNDTLVARSQYYIAISFDFQSEADSAIFYYNLAYQRFAKINDYEWMYASLENNNYLRYTQGRHEESIRDLLEMLDIFLAQGDDDKVAEIQSSIGYFHDRAGNYKHAIQWQRKALAYLKQGGDSIQLALALGRTGIAFDELQQYDSAHFYNYRALFLFRKLGEVHQQSTWSSNIGNTYSKQQQWDSARFYLKQACELSEGVSEYFEGALPFINLGFVYTQLQDYAKAREALYTGIMISERNDRWEERAEAYQRLYELFRAEGKIDSALFYLEQERLLKDTLFQLDRSRQVDELQIRYETAENQLKLTENEFQLVSQQLTIQQRNLQLILLLITLFVAAGVIVFGIRRVRARRRKLEYEGQLRRQQERLHLSRDLHDHLGAELTLLVSQLDQRAFTSSDPDEKRDLGAMSESTRRAMGQLRETIWAIREGNNSLNALSSNLLEYANKVNESGLLEIRTQVNWEKDRLIHPLQLLNIYRIGQEAIQNVIKHAQATKVEWTFRSEGEQLSMLIVDNGKGFDPAGISRGYGLENMKARARESNGELRIESNRGKGVRLEVICRIKSE